MIKIAVSMIITLSMSSMAFAVDDFAKAQAKTTFQAVCSQCHGFDGSNGLKGKSPEYILMALSGYKNKIFGGPKKAIMQEKASRLSDEQIKALAEYIGEL